LLGNLDTGTNSKSPQKKRRPPVPPFASRPEARRAGFLSTDHTGSAIQGRCGRALTAVPELNMEAEPDQRDVQRKTGRGRSKTRGDQRKTSIGGGGAPLAGKRAAHPCCIPGSEISSAKRMWRKPKRFTGKRPQEIFFAYSRITSH